MTHYDNIPSELKSLNQWVCARDDSKVPFQARLEMAASSTNPGSWSDFLTAYNAVELQHYYDYMGFVFSESDGLVGIDIDRGFDDDRFISDLGWDIVSHCKSYTEVSRSGRGFHILLRGTLPISGSNNFNGVEIYSSGRYFIMTGNIFYYSKIIENQSAIDYVVSKYFPQGLRESKSSDHGIMRERIYKPYWGVPVQDGKIRLRPDYPKITEGSRNISMCSLAGQLHSLGYSQEEMLDELRRANKQACVPPLLDYELEAICKSISKYRR